MDPILEAPVDVGDSGVVIEEAPSGVPIIALPSALTGLHYFDGQPMRDASLTAEQNYRRALAALSARTGGYGVAHGLNVEPVSGDVVNIGAGLAVDGLGRVLHLPSARAISMNALIASSRTLPMAMEETASTSPELLRCIKLWTKRAPAVRDAVSTWVVTASWAEASGAVKGGTVMREGVRLRALPLQLRTPLARSKAIVLDARVHLRSLTASAAFADEWARGGSLVSRDGLLRGAWCLGAQFDDRREVPLAVVAMAGDALLFADEWIVRRERHEAPPARYWAGLMRMRPWSAFLAQVLQFQCQLSDAGVAGGTLPRTTCDDTREVIANAATYLANVYALWQPAKLVLAEAYTPQGRDEAAILAQSGGATRLESLAREMIHLSNVVQLMPADRQLIRHGIVELPPAGFLPVSVGNKQTVNDQVRTLLGDGLDLRFCIATPDMLGEELEEAQHMERISLLRGIDDPDHKPRVDIFVPDGVSIAAPPPTGRYEASARIATTAFGNGVFAGTARRESLAGGGGALHLALSSVVARLVALLTRSAPDSAAAAAAAEPNDDALWLTIRSDRSIHTLRITESAHLTGRAVLATDASPAAGRELTFDGQLTMRAVHDDSPTSRTATATVAGTLAVIQRRATDAGDISAVLTRKLSLTVGFRWLESGDRGSMVADVLLNAGGATLSNRASTPSPTAPILRIEREWDARTGQTTIAIIAPQGLGWLVATAVSSTIGNAAAVAGIAVDGATAAAPEEFAVFELTENADVARESHPLHVLALGALRNVSALLDTESTFTRDALSALFPPADRPQLLIQATRDYVLFRRRRDHRVVPWTDPLTGTALHYRLLNITLGNQDEAAKLLATLRAQNANVPAEFRAAIVAARSAPPLFVEYRSQNAAPRNDAEELRTAFTQLAPGATILGGVISSNRGDDGPSLLARRLQAFIPLLAPAATLTPGAPLLALGATPPDLVTLDADGVVLLITA